MDNLLDRFVFLVKSRWKIEVWIIRFLFGLGIITFIAIVWGAYEIFRAPYDGLGFAAWGGKVVSVDPNGPTAGQIFVGDIVQEIEIKVMQEGLSLYKEEKIGDEVSLNVIRNDQIIEICFMLVAFPISNIISLLIPLLIGSLFFGLSLILFALKPWDMTIKLFYFSSQLGAICLVVGQLSNFFRPEFIGPFLTLLVLVGPFSLHFHINLLELRNRFLWSIIKLSYLVSVIMIFIYIYLWDSLDSINNKFHFYKSAPIILIINWTLVVLILAVTYFRFSNISIKSVIRLVSVGGLFGIVPIVVFSLVPYYVFGDYILPVQTGFLMLGIIPITYGYAILRHRLIQVEDRISRPAAQMLVFAFLFGIYLLVVALINGFGGLHLLSEPLILTIVFVMSGVIFTPLRKIVTDYLQRLIFGGAYDYRSLVMTSAQEITNSQDMHRLTDQIIKILERMHFPSGIIMKNSSTELVGLVQFGTEIPRDFRLPLKGSLATEISTLDPPFWHEDLINRIEKPRLTKKENAFLETANFRLWLPLKSRNELKGLLLLNTYYGKEAMTSEDADILETLGALIAIAMENVELLDTLHEKIISLEIAQAMVSESRRRLAVGREAERLFLARELHDGAIQDLHAIRIKLGGIDTSKYIDDIRKVNQRLLDVIYELRDLCANLRPPSLAHFGLKTALKSLVEKFETNNVTTNYWLDTQFNGFQHTDLSELTIYRILQESLGNISHHAQANNVWVRYSEEDPDIRLEIVDDGVGFHVPENFLEFARDGHLGLLGIAERVESIGGNLEVESKPGKGSKITVRAARHEILNRVEKDEEG